MYAVILAGGGGTRLWPLSRARRPKPFLPLLSDRTMIQATVARLSALLAPADIYVVTDARFVGFCAEQLPELPPGNIVAEPVARNTGPAVALAASAIDRAGDDVMAILPADHRVADEPAFLAALRAAETGARGGGLVTIGIEPTRPETGYGYVVAAADPGVGTGATELEPSAGGETTAAEPGVGTRTSGVPGAPARAAPVREVPEVAALRASRVERFVEKPTAERAAELLATHRAYWNAGMFVWRRDAILDRLARHVPDVLEPIRAAVSGGADLAGAYGSMRSISIDYAVMEPASLDGAVSVVPARMGWSDVGNWAALLELLGAEAGPDRLARVVAAGAESIDVGSHAVLIHAAGGRLVATVGLADVIVVDTPDVVLVVAKDAAQDVRTIVDRLAERRPDLL